MTSIIFAHHNLNQFKVFQIPCRMCVCVCACVHTLTLVSMLSMCVYSASAHSQQFTLAVKMHVPYSGVLCNLDWTWYTTLYASKKRHFHTSMASWLFIQNTQVLHYINPPPTAHHSVKFIIGIENFFFPLFFPAKTFSFSSRDLDDFFQHTWQNCYVCINFKFPTL